MTTSELFQLDGLCQYVDPEIFFPKNGYTAKEAKSICRLCPVKDPCLEYAVSQEGELLGVWGGMSDRERRVLRAERVVSGKREDERTA